MPRNLIDITDLSVEEINQLIATAEDIIANPVKYQDACAHKQLATLFFEPSTRTRLSFESAMLALGGSTLGFSEASSSSTAKGETVGDTIHTVSCYADIIAMRHPKEGAPYAASQFSEVPIINAGDGGHNHPTQTLTDLLTIHREKGRLNNFTIGFCGDLKFGRTVHSLVNALSRYDHINFVLISPTELKLPRYVKEEALKKKGIPYTQTTDLESVIPQLDILYMTRVQKERFFNEEDYPAPEGQLHPDTGEAGERQGGPVHPPPPAPCQRDHCGGGQGSPGRLLETGEERQVHPHGTDPEAAGHSGVRRRH